MKTGIQCKHNGSLNGFVVKVIQVAINWYLLKETCKAVCLAVNNPDMIQFATCLVLISNSRKIQWKGRLKNLLIVRTYWLLKVTRGITTTGGYKTISVSGLNNIDIFNKMRLLEPFSRGFTRCLFHHLQYAWPLMYFPSIKFTTQSRNLRSNWLFYIFSLPTQTMLNFIRLS